MYIETSTSPYPITISHSFKPGARAVLVSPGIDVTSQCMVQLVFYYSMFGATVGSLSVEVSDFLLCPTDRDVHH